MAYYLPGELYQCSRELYEFDRRYRRMFPYATKSRMESACLHEDHQRMVASPRYQSLLSKIAAENKRRTEQREADIREYSEALASLERDAAMKRELAKETMQRLWGERNAAQEEILKQRRAEIDAVPEQAMRDFLRRAKSLSACLLPSQLEHIAYLHLVKRYGLDVAIAAVESLPQSAWDNPLEMSTEEKEARRVLGIS
jgi:hypothetical protein